jgi:hypothetical protein
VEIPWARYCRDWRFLRGIPTSTKTWEEAGIDPDTLNPPSGVLVTMGEMAGAPVAAAAPGADSAETAETARSIIMTGAKSRTEGRPVSDAERNANKFSFAIYKQR